VNKRQLVVLLGFVLPFLVFAFTSCKKINEATELGSDLIPAVDNINTFDTTINVEAYNGIFTNLDDSQYLSRNEEQFLGRINNDPLFGQTDARMFFEMKPIVYPFAFDQTTGLTIDSVVMVLDYLESYGDSTVPQTVNVYEIAQNPAEEPFRYDSIYQIRKQYFSTSTQLGSRTFIPSTLNDSVKVRQDTTKNQLRIKLNNSFGQRLLNYDSTATGAYRSDSAFRTKFKGFALQSMNTGNAAMSFNLGGTNSKLGIYYHYAKAGGGDSSTFTYFRFTTLSAADNYIQRNHSTGEINTYLGGASPDPLVYLQNSPGSYARLKWSDIMNVSNRVVHRAELIVEQVYHPSDTVFRSPEVLFLDAIDPSLPDSVPNFRTIPYDFTYDASGASNAVTFGMYPFFQLDPTSGTNTRVWRFNISRYVQHLLTRTATYYDLRLTSPFTLIEQYGIPGITNDATAVVTGNSTVVRGRVRVGGGNHPTHRLRLRLIYSKI
jgi:hypothetical protein